MSADHQPEKSNILFLLITLVEDGVPRWWSTRRFLSLVHFPNLFVMLELNPHLNRFLAPLPSAATKPSASVHLQMDLDLLLAKLVSDKFARVSSQARCLAASLVAIKRTSRFSLLYHMECLIRSVAMLTLITTQRRKPSAPLRSTRVIFPRARYSWPPRFRRRRWHQRQRFRVRLKEVF